MKKLIFYLAILFVLSDLNCNYNGLFCLSSSISEGAIITSASTSEISGILNTEVSLDQSIGEAYALIEVLRLMNLPPDMQMQLDNIEKQLEQILEIINNHVFPN